MPYRDELEAALARADALQQRVDELEKEKAAPPAPAPAEPEPPLPPPPPPPALVKVVTWHPAPLRDASSDKMIGSTVGAGLLIGISGLGMASVLPALIGALLFASGVFWWAASAKSVTARAGEVIVIRRGSRIRVVRPGQSDRVINGERGLRFPLGAAPSAGTWLAVRAGDGSMYDVGYTAEIAVGADDRAIDLASRRFVTDPPREMEVAAREVLETRARALVGAGEGAPGDLEALSAEVARGSAAALADLGLVLLSLRLGPPPSR